jgi:NAD-dependent dihydropyrimidine dehydrogenase PreA subunit
LIRKIINIDEDKCTGCGDCIPECKEGALQIIDGKCRLISELFCDGLGACIGFCPEGAITIEEREAEPYDEVKVIQGLLDKPHSVLKAHLQHLKDHGADDYLTQAINYLEKIGIENPINMKNGKSEIDFTGCSGSLMKFPIDDNTEAKYKEETEEKEHESQLRQWPVHLHLVNPNMPYLKDRILVIMSVCGPIASANIHEKYLKGNAVVVACPKLDYTDPYAEKLAAIFLNAQTHKVIIVRMEVPCCSGLSSITSKAVSMSGRSDIDIEEHILTINGSLKKINSYNENKVV